MVAGRQCYSVCYEGVDSGDDVTVNDTSDADNRNGVIIKLQVVATR